MNRHAAKDKFQKEAKDKWLKKDCKGIVLAATGSGKTKLACDCMAAYEPVSCLIVCDSTKNRDDTWPEEINKWCPDLKDRIDIICYHSLAKVSKSYDMIVLDECDVITDLRHSRLRTIKHNAFLAITATKPEKDKLRMLKTYAPIIYTLSLSDAVTAGIVSNFEITVHRVALDNKEKYLEAGNKKNRFYSTEKKQYDYFTSQVRRHEILSWSATTKKEKDQHEYLKTNYIYKRARIIQGSLAKQNKAKELLLKYSKERTLIFSHTIERADELGDSWKHSNKDDLEKFQNYGSMHLSTCKSLDRGANINDLDRIVIVQLTSKDRQLIQRIGRVVRFREDHVGLVDIIVAKDTVDERWFYKAIENLGVSFSFK